jgi:hypothetical protein
VSEPLSKTIVWIVALITPAAVAYEAYALATDHITISRFLRGLVESYHPLYLFAGVGAPRISARMPSRPWRSTSYDRTCRIVMGTRRLHTAARCAW